MNILKIFLPMGIFCFVVIHSRNIEAVDTSLISVVVTGI